MPNAARFQLSLSRRMVTKKCGCRRCGQARWNLWQNRSMTKRYSRVSAPHWRVDPGVIVFCARRSFVGAVATIGAIDQDRIPRRFEQIIGNSPALESVLEQVERVAPTDSTVLIQGETGT